MFSLAEVVSTSASGVTILARGLVELSVGLVEPLVRVPPTVIREFL